MPALSADVENLATAPALRVPFPSEVDPSRNVTVPVGTLALAVDVTVAVNVTLAPVATLLADAVSAVLLASRFGGGATCPTLFNSTVFPTIRSGCPSPSRSVPIAVPKTESKRV